MSEQKKQSLQRRKRVFDIIETGAASDWVSRGRENIVPRGDIILNSNDVLILGAEALKDDIHIELKEVVLLKHNPWNGMCIRDLGISRQTIIVMVKRNGTMLVPKGNMVLLQGDHVILYSQEFIANQNLISV